MLWWVLGSLIACSSVVVLWLAVEKATMRRWRRRQRMHIQTFLLRNPEAGELQVDGTYSYRRGPHVFHYLYHPERVAPDHLVWVSIRQRVTEWDRPSQHIRRWLQVVCSAWLLRLMRWQTGAVLIVVLVVGIGVMDRTRGRQARLEATVASVLHAPLTDVRLERGGESAVAHLERTQLPAGAAGRLRRFSHRWFSGHPVSFVLHLHGRDVGYLVPQGGFSDDAEVWLEEEGRWRHGILTNHQLVWE